MVVPGNANHDVMYLYHDHAEVNHPGRDETARAIKENFYWSGMDEDVRNYVSECLICETVKAARRQQETPLRPYSPRRPWQMDSE